MPRVLPCLLALALSFPAAAPTQTAPDAPVVGPQGLWVTNTDICPALRDGAELIEAMGETDALALGPAGIEGVEYHCAFEPDLDLAAPDQSISTHMGYCEEPGLITPRLFTFRVERLDSPRATLYDGSDEALTFFACPP